MTYTGVPLDVQKSYCFCALLIHCLTYNAHLISLCQLKGKIYYFDSTFYCEIN